MAIIAAAPIVLPRAGLGAPFPDATIIVEPDQSMTTDIMSKQKECFVRYQLKTDAPIKVVSDFYLNESYSDGATLLNDSGSKIPDYRTLTFREPKFMVVVLDRWKSSTTINVSYRLKTNCG